METGEITIDVHVDPGDLTAEMASDVAAGLSRRPKELPSKYFYDERGSLLFEDITRLPEYYLTRAERALLERVAGEVAGICRPRDLVELGSGSARKTRLLLEAGRERSTLRRYVPFDVSREMAESSALGLVERYPGLDVHAVVGDFERHLEHIPPGEGRLVAFLGSTIGNFLRPQAVRFLTRLASILGPDDWFLLGTDLVKSRQVLEAAYDDRQGVTAEFNRNVLRVVNRNLEADFDVERFEHVAFYDEAGARVEMHLRATEVQEVRIESLDRTVRFERDEMMRTEVSCKYTRESVGSMLADAGLELEHWFTDDDRAFALSLSRLGRGGRSR